MEWSKKLKSLIATREDSLKVGHKTNKKVLPQKMAMAAVKSDNKGILP